MDSEEKTCNYILKTTQKIDNNDKIFYKSFIVLNNTIVFESKSKFNGLAAILIGVNDESHAKNGMENNYKMTHKGMNSIEIELELEPNGREKKLLNIKEDNLHKVYAVDFLINHLKELEPKTTKINFSRNN